jgi:hypothetical protein
MPHSGMEACLMMRPILAGTIMLLRGFPKTQNREQARYATSFRLTFAKRGK